MRIVAMRHGITDFNVERRIQGTLDSSLTDEGRALAGRHAAWLAGLGLGPWAILCSPMLRTRQTAEIVGDALGVEPRIEEGLAEIGRGIMEGRLKETLPPELARAYREFRVRPWEVRMPGGAESFVDLERRVRRKVVPVIEGLAPGPVLAVTHGAVVKLLAMLLCRYDRQMPVRVETPHHHLFDIDDGQLTIRDGNAGHRPLESVYP